MNLNPPFIKIQNIYELEENLEIQFSCPCHTNAVIYQLPSGHQVRVSTELDVDKKTIISAIVKKWFQLIFQNPQTGHFLVQPIQMPSMIKGPSATNKITYQVLASDHDTILKTESITEEFMKKLNSFTDTFNNNWKKPFPLDHVKAHTPTAIIEKQSSYSSDVSFENSFSSDSPTPKKKVKTEKTSFSGKNSSDGIIVA